MSIHLTANGYNVGWYDGTLEELRVTMPKYTFTVDWQEGNCLWVTVTKKRLCQD